MRWGLRRARSLDRHRAPHHGTYILGTARRLAATRSPGVNVGGSPRFAGALLDVAPYQAAHHLRRRRVFVRTQSLEQLLLAGVDQDGKPGGALFGGQMELTSSDM
jgi:hypothetical protein